MSSLSGSTFDWFCRVYAHAGLTSPDREEALDTVMEDMAFFEALEDGQISLRDLPAVPAFEDLRHWRIRLDTALHLLGYPERDSVTTQALHEQWKEANRA